MLLDAPLPQWLQEPVLPRLLSIPLETGGDSDYNIFTGSPHRAPNHVLINEYNPGQGIMPHKDGPAYYPVVCTISLGASLCLDIYRTGNDGQKEERPAWRILQEPRSLLVTTDQMYTDYMHGIADVVEEDDLGPMTIANWALLGCPEDLISGSFQRQSRTSLTFRDVVKVSKLSSKLGLFVKP